MSLVLGPIHHWMHKKIRISEAREKAIVEALKKKYGKEADTILQDVYKKYPPSQTEGQALEELLEDKPIHAGIQGLIDDVETREAAVVAAFYAKYGEAAKEEASKAAYEHGLTCAKQVVKEKNLGQNGVNPGRAFELLLDNFCDGMPCDRGAQVLDEDNKHIVWDHTACVHSRYWEVTQAPPKAMCEIITAWISGFGKGLNPAISYERNKSIAFGDDCCISTYKVG